MINRNELSELYPDAKKEVFSNNNTDIISFKMVIKSAVIIALLMTLPVAAFIVIVNYFMHIINIFNIINLLPIIILSLVAWAILLVFVLKSVSEKLSRLVMTNVTFLITYGLSVLPVAQLIFNLYRHFNNGLVDTLPYIGLLFVENFLFVPIILLLMNSSGKIINKLKTVLFIILIILCAFVSYLNIIYK